MHTLLLVTLTLLSEAGRDAPRSTGGHQPLCHLQRLVQPRESEIRGPERPSPYTIVIEGNTGCGKSTFISSFHLTKVTNRPDVPPVELLEEPVSEWRNVSGTNLLELAIKNGRRWEATFELQAMLSRLRQALQGWETSTVTDLRHPRISVIKVTERSLFSQRYCFLDYAASAGIMEQPAEVALVDSWFRFAVGTFKREVRPDLILYLRADLDVIVDRIKQRNRPEEQGDHGMSLDFLRGLQTRYDDWLFFKNSSYPVPAPVVTLDSNLGIEDFQAQAHQRLLRVLPSEVALALLGSVEGSRRAPHHRGQ